MENAQQFKVVYTFKNCENESMVLGIDDKYLKAIAEKYKIEIIASNGEILISSIEYEEDIYRIFHVLELCAEENITLSDGDFYSILYNVDVSNYQKITTLYTKKQVLLTTLSGKPIFPRTLNQKMYLKAIEENDIVFGIGQAGTGKTYIAAIYALSLLKSGKVRKIILARPIVEAGEKLGFLPGDFKEKIDPYLIPLYDSFYEFLGKEAVDKMIEKGTIEIAPLAYMRGRTLENCVVVLDEAQNTTQTQMKMFLTRLGLNSKMIITGDVTQIDLPNKSNSGLVEAVNLLSDVKGIKIVKFTKYDVMRHPLVYKIIEKYEGK